MSVPQGSAAGAGGEKKLIIDEDWKSQVEAEKAAAEAARAGTSPSAAAGSSTSSPTAASSPTGEAVVPGTKQQAPPLPPADLSTLVTMLATQAMVSLGALPNPLSRQVETDIPQARHFVDLLGMLETKTKGNTTPEEARLFDGILHELRMACVHAKA